MELTESQKQNLMVVVMLGLMLIGGVWWYQFTFGGNARAANLKRAEDLADQSKELKARLDRYRELQNDIPQIQELKQRVLQAANRLPREPRENQFHQILTDTLAQTGVYPIRVEPQGRVEREFYTELPYKLECFAKYHDLGELFNLIEENRDRMMRIRSFTITNESDAPTERPSVQYAEVDIASYSLNPSSRALDESM